jgi:hypothetical protein
MNPPPTSPAPDARPTVSARSLFNSSRHALVFTGRQALTVAAALESVDGIAPKVRLSSQYDQRPVEVEWRLAYRALRDGPTAWHVELVLGDVVSSTEARRV